MQSDMSAYVSSHEIYQLHTAKYCQTADTIVSPTHSTVPFETIRLNFVELRVKAEAAWPTGAFLVIQTSLLAGPPRAQGDRTPKASLPAILPNSKTTVSDNGPVVDCTTGHNNEGYDFSHQYHTARLQIALRRKQFGTESSTVLSNLSREEAGNAPCASMTDLTLFGCSSRFAAFNTPRLFPAGEHLLVIDHVARQEQGTSQGELADTAVE